MINITGRVARLRYLREMGRLMLAIELSFAYQTRRIIAKQYNDVAESIKNNDHNIDYIIDNSSTKFYNTFVAYFTRMAENFRKKTISETEKRSMLPPETKTIEDEYWAEMNYWIRHVAANKVTKINRATKNNIRRILNKGISEGKTNFEIAKDLRTIKKIATPIRSKRISRTETHSGSVKSVDSAISSTRIEMEREWVSAIDERTRPTSDQKNSQFDHRRADGEKTSQDGLFTATGETLHYPGDPDGSAGNIINCRCVLIYHAKNMMEE